MTMIKVTYDKNGEISGFYPDTIDYLDIPVPYLEISENEYKKIFADLQNYKIINNAIVDVSDNQDYIYQRSIYENTRKIAQYKKDIENLENSQHRLVREYIIAPSDKIKNEINNIDIDIDKIRKKMQSIQI